MFEVDNEFKNANVPRTIRFTETLFDELNKIASENGVSFNLLVLQCCKYAMENLINATTLATLKFSLDFLRKINYMLLCNLVYYGEI